MKPICFAIALLLTPFIGISQWIMFDVNDKSYIIIAAYHYIIFTIYYNGSSWLVEMLIDRLNLQKIPSWNKYANYYGTPIALTAVGALISYGINIYDRDTIFDISYLNTFIPIVIPVIMGSFITVRRHNRKIFEANP